MLFWVCVPGYNFYDFAKKDIAFTPSLKKRFPSLMKSPDFEFSIKS